MCYIYYRSLIFSLVCSTTEEGLKLDARRRGSFLCTKTPLGYDGESELKSSHIPTFYGWQLKGH